MILFLIKTDDPMAYLFFYPVPGRSVPIAVNESHFALAKYFFLSLIICLRQRPRASAASWLVSFPLTNNSMTLMRLISFCDNATLSYLMPSIIPSLIGGVTLSLTSYRVDRRTKSIGLATLQLSQNNDKIEKWRCQ